MRVETIVSRIKIQCDSEEELDTEIAFHRAEGYSVIDLWVGDKDCWVIVEKVLE